MVTGIVLAGGKSSRMGYNKCFIPFQHTTIIQKNISILEYFTGNILISANTDDFDRLGYRIVPDRFKNCGPMGGIYSAIRESRSPVNIIITCDMPFLNVELYEYLLRKFESFDAVVPVYDSKIEPLCGIYSDRVVNVAAEKIRIGSYKITSLLESVNTLYVPITPKLKFYSEKLFANINTQEDAKMLSYFSEKQETINL